MDIRTAKAAAGQTADLLVIGAREGAVADAVERALGGAGAGFATAAADDEFKAKVGTKVTYPAMGLEGVTRVAIVGLGETPDDDAFRRAAGQAGSFARGKKATSVVLDLGALDAGQAAAAVEGFVAGNYRYDGYKPEKERTPTAESLTLAGAVDDGAVAAAQALAAGQALARDLVNAPPADIYPETLAAAALELASEHITVDVWDEARIRDAGMGGIIAVGQGSERPARLIHMHYKPTGAAKATLGLVGKGVTFDSGGLSLKPSNSMQTMRCDMGGGGTVIGVFRALRDLQPDVEVHGFVGAVENMNSGGSYKLGDILTMYNGKTVEVHNTDAEGRLVLADCLHLACETGVDELVDIATLTGAAVVALGPHYTGLFSNDDDLVGDLLGAADGAGEGLWRMPLPDFYKEMLKAEWGTIKNVGGRAAGASTAALFLKEFVDGPKWAHLDIAGPAFLDKPTRHYVSGATGAMVPTLTRWILSR
jgi:leucyl aminopeptidase